MARLDNKFILPAYGIVFSKEELPQIISPLMIYKDLEKILRARKGLPSDFTDEMLLSFTTQIAYGMAYLTFRGLVHRDLAARNCMMTESEHSIKHGLNHYHIKIADLGLTQDTQYMDLNTIDPDHLGHIEENKNIQLPLKWLAPEILDKMIFNEQTDVWAFGVTVWEILTRGNKPYIGMNPVDAIKRVQAGHRLSQPNNCPKFLWDLLVQGCWHKNPFLRKSFINLKEELKQAYPITYEKELEMPPIQLDLLSKKKDFATLKRKQSTGHQHQNNINNQHLSAHNHSQPMTSHVSNTTLRSENGTNGNAPIGGPRHNQSVRQIKKQSVMNRPSNGPPTNPRDRISESSSQASAANNSGRNRLASAGEASAMKSGGHSPSKQSSNPGQSPYGPATPMLAQTQNSVFEFPASSNNSHPQPHQIQHHQMHQMALKSHNLSPTPLTASNLYNSNSTSGLGPTMVSHQSSSVQHDNRGVITATRQQTHSTFEQTNFNNGQNGGFIHRQVSVTNSSRRRQVYSGSQGKSFVGLVFFC